MAKETIFELKVVEGDLDRQRERIREQWRKEYGLRLYRGVPCWTKLVGKRCPYQTGKVAWHHECNPPAGDHLSLWTKAGVPAVLVSQPYQFSYQDIKETVAWCEEFGLLFEIDWRPSWHYHGRVYTIFYWDPRRDKLAPSRYGGRYMWWRRTAEQLAQDEKDAREQAAFEQACREKAR